MRAFATAPLRVDELDLHRPTRVVRRPVAVQVMPWSGDNLDELESFARLAAEVGGYADRPGIARLYPRWPLWPHDDRGQLNAYNHLERIWVPVPVGHLLVRGAAHELYPCDPRVAEHLYDVVVDDDRPRTG